jgi:ribonuclease P protein component
MDVYRGPNGTEHARLGLVVPKRIVARAVDRNRIKRICREAFRLDQRQLAGEDVVVRIKAVLEVAGYRADWDAFLRAAATPVGRPGGGPNNG